MHHYEVVPLSAGRFIVRCLECWSEPVEVGSASQVHAYIELGHEVARVLGIGEALVVAGSVAA